MNTQPRTRAADGPTALDTRSFVSFVSRGVVLVDFWAPWCGPCRAQARILEELAPQFAGQARIGTVNVDENPDLAAGLAVRGIPALFLFKDGRLVGRFEGVQSPETLAAALRGRLN